MNYGYNMKLLGKVRENLTIFVLAGLVILIILIFYVHDERTVYYWDFGDYQHTLSDLQGSFFNPSHGFFANIVKIQKSEYPLNWASFFVLIPHGFFAKRIFFVSYLGLCGLLPWAFSAKILIEKILFSKIYGNVAFVILLLSPGPWMLVFRGWPDVVALGLIWLGFAIAFKPATVKYFCFGIFLISYGAIMRKTTVILAAVLLVLLVLQLLFKYAKIRLNAIPLRNIFYTILSIAIVIFLTPGTYLTIFGRNNAQFYRPFNVTWFEYFNNLFSINGSIQVVGAAILPFLMIALNKISTKYTISWKLIIFFSVIPIIQMILWMKILSQATDHHMVQWVPMYFALSVAFLCVLISELIQNKWKKVGITSLIILINMLLFAVTLLMTVTPLGNPQYSFERPIARSLAPIRRPDFNSLMSLGIQLAALSSKNIQNIAILNESHEMNSGIVQDLKRKFHIINLSTATIGALDYRDDIGLNQLLDANLFLVPTDFITLIPDYQNNLMILAKDLQKYAISQPNEFLPVSQYLIGAAAGTKSWWNNQYIKSSSLFTLYKLAHPLSLLTKEKISNQMIADIIKAAHFSGSYILAFGPHNGFGPSATNGNTIKFSLSAGESAGIQMLNKSLEINTNCYSVFKVGGKISIKLHPGSQKISTSMIPGGILILHNAKTSANSMSCSYQLLNK